MSEHQFGMEDNEGGVIVEETQETKKPDVEISAEELFELLKDDPEVKNLSFEEFKNWWEKQ